MCLQIEVVVVRMHNGMFDEETWLQIVSVLRDMLVISHAPTCGRWVESHRMTLSHEDVSEFERFFLERATLPPSANGLHLGLAKVLLLGLSHLRGWLAWDRFAAATRMDLPRRGRK